MIAMHKLNPMLGELQSGMYITLTIAIQNLSSTMQDDELGDYCSSPIWLERNMRFF